MEKQVKKQIVLPKGVSEDLQKTFKVSEVAVRRAVYFDDKDSGRAKMLRAAAMQRGGILVDADKAYKLTDHTFVINSETGDMVFSFSENLVLSWQRHNNTLTWDMPNEVRTYENIVELTALHSFLMAAEADHQSMIQY